MSRICIEHPSQNILQRYMPLMVSLALQKLIKATLIMEIDKLHPFSQDFSPRAAVHHENKTIYNDDWQDDKKHVYAANSARI